MNNGWLWEADVEEGSCQTNKCVRKALVRHGWSNWGGAVWKSAAPGPWPLLIIRQEPELRDTEAAVTKMIGRGIEHKDLILDPE